MGGDTIATITAPQLKSVMGEDVSTFKIKYDAYLNKVAEFNKGRAKEQTLPPAGYKSCIEPELLSSLVLLNTFPAREMVDDVTDEDVSGWLKTRSRVSGKAVDSQVSDALRRITFKPRSSDPQGAALRFFTSVTTELNRNCAAHVITESPKALIQELMPKLEPKSLRDKMTSAMKFWAEADKRNFRHFVKEVTSTYVEMAPYIEDKKPFTKKDKSPGNGKKPSSDTDGDKQQGGASSKGKPYSSSKNEPTDKKAKKRKSSEWTDKCLNPKCNKIHRVVDCDITSDKDKKKLLSEYYDSKKKPKAAAIGRGPVGDGRWKVILNNEWEAIALGDYGADTSAIPKKIMNNVGVAVELFENPINLQTAIHLTNDTFTASGKVKLDITVCLPCGPLRLRKVEFLVIDQDMDELCLGRPLLKCFGFNLDSHLAKVRTDFDGADISELMSTAPESHGTQAKSISSADYKGVWYDQADDDPIELPNTAEANIGEDSEADIQAAFSLMCDQAQKNGISNNGLSRLRSLLKTYRDIFRINLGADPPGRVEPLRIRLKDNHRPVRAKQRRYAPKQSVFIKNAVRKLESIGAIRKNQDSRWASPVLAVPKPGSDKLRFTVDLRAPNRETIPIASTMPDLDEMIQSTAGSKVYAKMDMCHAYWQIPLHKDSQECMSIQTPIGVYTPVRLLQGQTDSGNHFQSVTTPIFGEAIGNVVQWLDDFLVHSVNEGPLLDSIEMFFSQCQKYGLKLHAKKCDLFLKEAPFCGRLIDESGIKFNPRDLATLLNMRKPEFASDLQQFLCASNWMRRSIPEYAKTIAPLHALMEACFAKAQKRTKRAVQNISLHGLWGTDHDIAFKQVQTHLTHAIKLAFPLQDHRLCLFTDASETHWGSVLTQVEESQLSLDVEEQNHKPLSFLSGSFKNSSERWSIVEKEAFSVVESMTKLDHFTALGEVSLYTDHANLVYIFDPYGRNPGISKHTAHKLMRWALKLSTYRYVIEHLAGERNVWADILTRWAVKPRSKVSSLKIAGLMYAPINASCSEEYDWPTYQDFQNACTSTSEEPPKGFTLHDGAYKNPSGVVWIPKEYEQLRLRVIIAGHTGRGGHRGIEATKLLISSHFYWQGMSSDITTFVKSCLHCLCTATGKTIPRPLGHSMHADKPNKILHFDFCSIGPSDKGFKYVLILKDDFSSYVLFFPFEHPNSESAVEALMEWFSAFGVVLQWVSDRGSHFKNEVVAGLSQKLKGSHHFTLPYCPWTNGTVEVVCREMMRAMKALLSEFQLPFKHWPAVLPIVQSILNSTPLKRLGNRSPLTAFTGLPSDSPLLTMKADMKSGPKHCTLEHARAVQLAQVNTLMDAMDNMHRDIADKTGKARAKQIQKHNIRTHVKPCNFDVGDYVLRSFSEKLITKKLSFRWRGPFQVTKVLSDFLFEVEDIRSKKRNTVHGSRLKLFRNKDYEVTTDTLEQLAFQDGEYCIVEKIIDIRKKDGDIQIQVQWRGFDDEDTTWEEYSVMKDDIPGLVDDFINEVRDNGTPRQQRVVKNI